MLLPAPCGRHDPVDSIPWRNGRHGKRPKSPRSVPLKRDVDQPLVSRYIVTPDLRQSRLLLNPMPTSIEPAASPLTGRDQ